MSTRLSIHRPSDTLIELELSGDWTLGIAAAPSGSVDEQLKRFPAIRRMAFDSARLKHWDSSLLTYVMHLRRLCAAHRVQFDSSGLPQGARQLLALAAAAPGHPPSAAAPTDSGILERVGRAAVGVSSAAGDLLAFVGETAGAVGRLFAGRARFRWSDVFAVIYTCGPQALPIVSLISVLVGIILAFMGAVQLKQFGAEIYVAALVGIAMVRVMGAVMAAVIMAGRTGAAFAAHLGTMQVNEEIDALITMGIRPMEFLVLPRLLALTVMMPLLCLYADLMGLIGGIIVGAGLMGLNLVEYLDLTRDAIGLTDVWIGLFQSVIFGVLIAVAGCMRGIQCGRSASAVGDATTRAVVSSIVYIVIATAVVTVGCDILGI